MWKDLILWKESLNNDYQQFHQYQQNEQSLLPSLIEHIKGGPRHVTVIYESLPTGTDKLDLLILNKLSLIFCG